MKSGLLKNKVILVTGANRGIGLAIVRACIDAGARIVLNYRARTREIQPLLTQLKKQTKQVMALKADVGNSSEVKKMFSEIKKKFGKLDALVNNAGIRRDDLILNASEKDFDEIVRVNLKGSFLCMREAARLMLASRGRVINISSIVGTHGNRGQAVYSASKSGLIGLTKSAAKELGQLGIMVNAVSPGLIDTDMVADLNAKQRTRLIEHIPLGRAGRPEEVASVVVFLASDLATYINGQVIGVDGGMIM